MYYEQKYALIIKRWQSPINRRERAPSIQLSFQILIRSFDGDLPPNPRVKSLREALLQALRSGRWLETSFYWTKAVFPQRRALNRDTARFRSIPDFENQTNLFNLFCGGQPTSTFFVFLLTEAQIGVSFTYPFSSWRNKIPPECNNSPTSGSKAGPILKVRNEVLKKQINK